MDVLAGGVAGLCGGFIGVNAPVLISHFGQFLNKQYLRRLLVIIFIPSAIMQSTTFYLNGMLGRDVIVLGLLSLPMMIVGVYLGNKAHHRVSDVWFKRILGAFLCYAAQNSVHSILNTAHTILFAYLELHSRLSIKMALAKFGGVSSIHIL